MLIEKGADIEALCYGHRPIEWIIEYHRLYPAFQPTSALTLLLNSGAKCPCFHISQTLRFTDALFDAILRSGYQPSHKHSDTEAYIFGHMLQLKSAQTYKMFWHQLIHTPPGAKNRLALWQQQFTQVSADKILKQIRRSFYPMIRIQNISLTVPHRYIQVVKWISNKITQLRMANMPVLECLGPFLTCTELYTLSCTAKRIDSRFFATQTLSLKPPRKRIAI